MTDLKHSMNILDIKTREANFLKLVIAILLLICLVLGSMLFWALRHTQTIIVPQAFNAPATVSDANVDASYLTQTTLSLINERYNVTPQTVTEAHNLILRYVAPKLFPAFQPMLTDEAADIKAQGLTAAFFVDSIKVDDGSLTVYVKGTLKEWSNAIDAKDNTLPDQPKSFALQYQYQGGLLKLINWSEDTK